MARSNVKKSPVAKISVGLVTANIWETINEKGTFHTVSFERRYRDKHGNWKTTHSFKAGTELLAITQAASLANDKIINVTMGDEPWQ